MTFIKCPECGFVGTVACVDIYHNVKTGEWITESPALKWKCPRCGYDNSKQSE